LEHYQHNEGVCPEYYEVPWELEADASSHHRKELYNTQGKSKENNLIYTISIPVSDTRSDALRALEESTPALLEKAGLAGAKIFLLFIPLGVDFDELPAIALSNSVVIYKQSGCTKYPDFTHRF
jgi:hypothetical protein